MPVLICNRRRLSKERLIHLRKHWKVSPVDLAILDKWEDKTRAKEAMFFATAALVGP